MSYSLNSLKGGSIRDYIGGYYKGIKGDIKSVATGSCQRAQVFDSVFLVQGLGVNLRFQGCTPKLVPWLGTLLNNLRGPHWFKSVLGWDHLDETFLENNLRGTIQQILR